MRTTPRFNIIIATGMYSRCAILLVPAKYQDKIDALMRQLDKDIATGKESIFPKLPGVYLIDLCIGIDEQYYEHLIIHNTELQQSFFATISNEFKDDPVAQCMSCEWHYPKKDCCTNEDIKEILYPCPEHKPADNPGFVISDSKAKEIHKQTVQKLLEKDIN